ncbi:MAG: tRNA-dihydrouridine synthase family protein [Bacteroidales bacterium]|nr:tRNA-dihydrouridine synthase family protein [Bacteroidales bacterium]
MNLFFAPLQGYTHAAYRRLHHEIVGGITAYYTPFIRWEHGVVRNKDLRDVSLESCRGVPTIPQIIARDLDEMRRLCDLLQTMGWQRIDLNLGCPFPMQTGAGRGSGLLPHPDRVWALIEEMRGRREVRFSVKMRLGLDTADECLRLLPMLNEAGLSHIVLHPRTGRQQYRGVPNREAFAAFYEGCRLPLVYNGDVATMAQADELCRRFPRLHGVMIGRGLLACPTMHMAGLTDERRKECVRLMHERLLSDAVASLNGDQQVLDRMRAFWLYQEPHIERKLYKRIMKAGSLRNYGEAVEAYFN